MFSRANKEFLIFIFFLALSAIFWFILTMNEVYVRQVPVCVRVTDVPRNIVLTSDDIDTIQVTLRDKGWVLSTYLTGSDMLTAEFRFNDHRTGNGVATITSADIQKYLAQRLNSSTTVVQVKTDRLDFFYNHGQSKKVPVRWRGLVEPDEMYFISEVGYSPDSVVVYAAPEVLDTLRAVFTEPLNQTGFRDSLKLTARIARVGGVKIVPDRTSITFITDVLSEVHLNGVLIHGINLPDGKILRTFPSRVGVKFVTGVRRFKELRPSDFIVVADYNEIRRRPSAKCHIQLKQVPHGVQTARLDESHVDYLIEEE